MRWILKMKRLYTVQAIAKIGWNYILHNLQIFGISIIFHISTIVDDNAGTFKISKAYQLTPPLEKHDSTRYQVTSYELPFLVRLRVDSLPS